MYAVGGSKLVDNVFKTFSKELETLSLADLRQRITDCLSSLTSGPDLDAADVNRAYISQRRRPAPSRFPTNYQPVHNKGV